MTPELNAAMSMVSLTQGETIFCQVNSVKCFYGYSKTAIDDIMCVDIETLKDDAKLQDTINRYKSNLNDDGYYVEKEIIVNIDDLDFDELLFDLEVLNEPSYLN
jgi:GH43 family beta-xylosidase